MLNKYRPKVGYMNTTVFVVSLFILVVCTLFMSIWFSAYWSSAGFHAMQWSMISIQNSIHCLDLSQYNFDKPNQCYWIDYRQVVQIVLPWDAFPEMQVHCTKHNQPYHFGYKFCIRISCCVVFLCGFVLLNLPISFKVTSLGLKHLHSITIANNLG